MNLSKTVFIAAATACASLAVAQEPMQPSKVRELLMANNDTDFMLAAASAGQFEVESGELAQSKATDPALRTFADQMVNDHAQAGEKLAELAQKKGVSLPTTLKENDQKMLDSLSKAKAGADFDDLYRKDMVKAHKEAVALFDNTAKHSKDPDVKAFAASTLPILEHHGGMAESLKSSS